MSLINSLGDSASLLSNNFAPGLYVGMNLLSRIHLMFNRVFMVGSFVVHVPSSCSFRC